MDDKPDEALALLPGVPTASLDYFAFSQQMLRVLALEADRQYDKERKLVLDMLLLAKLPLKVDDRRQLFLLIDGSYFSLFKTTCAVISFQRHL